MKTQQQGGGWRRGGAPSRRSRGCRQHSIWYWYGPHRRVRGSCSALKAATGNTILRRLDTGLRLVPAAAVEALSAVSCMVVASGRGRMGVSEVELGAVGALPADADVFVDEI